MLGRINEETLTSAAEIERGITGDSSSSTPSSTPPPQVLPMNETLQMLINNMAMMMDNNKGLLARINILEAKFNETSNQHSQLLRMQFGTMKEMEKRFAKVEAENKALTGQVSILTQTVAMLTTQSQPYMQMYVPPVSPVSLPMPPAIQPQLSQVSPVHPPASPYSYRHGMLFSNSVGTPISTATQSDLPELISNWSLSPTQQ